MFTSQTHNRFCHFSLLGDVSFSLCHTVSFQTTCSGFFTLNCQMNWISFLPCAYSLYDVWKVIVRACMFSMPRRKSAQRKLFAHIRTHMLCVHSEKWSCPHLYNLMKFVNWKANGCFDESSAVKRLKDYLLMCFCQRWLFFHNCKNLQWS